MSRTFRRTENWLIREEVGRIDDIREWHLVRYNTDDPVVAYTRLYYDFITSDEPYFRTSAPRWYRRVMGTKAWRVYSAKEIRRCMNIDCWDNFLPPVDMNDTRGWW